MILESAKTYLSTTSSVRIAHLVQIELAGTEGVYDYITDYMSNITYQGNIYSAGKVTKIGSVILKQGIANYQLSISVAGEFQEELDKGTSDESMEGRKIKVYKAYLDDSGSIIPFDSETNGPLILFEGSIGRIAINEIVTKGSSIVTWNCVGELADFEKVNGRLTDDASHRGLVSGGLNDLPVPSDGAKKEAYKTDTGFLHANQTVSTAIKYLSKEKEYYLKKSWGGLKTKLREREIEVEREVDINTSLAAKYLPVVYGVRRVTGIPVFMDVLADTPNIAFVVYAVCEGEIDAFLNVYVDGVSAICGDSTEAEGSGVCMGDMASGDTLSIYTNTNETAYRTSKWAKYKFDSDGRAGDFNTGSTPVTDSKVGTTHGDRFNIAAEKGAVELTFYHGKADQTPNTALVTAAINNGFLLQRTTKDSSGNAWGANYWANSSVGSSGAALLDTAYVVAKFALSDQRDSIPNIEFVVQGRRCKVYTDPDTFSVEYTLNPVWHLLDYITNYEFGAGLPVSRVDINSWIQAANKLDEVDNSYDSSFLTYWRYIGWLTSSYSKARMQCNTLITTEDSVTKVVESILEQFDGTIVTKDGKLSLSIENDDAPIASIAIEDVIGGVSLQDQANKDKWNSINAGIVDPAMGWGVNQINFFNSTYLAEDNNVRKKGRANFSHITNYYTARSWAEIKLNKSRFKRTISFTTYYKFSFLEPNDNVLFTYPRFNYLNAKFRVVSVEAMSDGLVRLTLQRYESYIFNSSGQSKTEVPGGGADPTKAPENLGVVFLPSELIDLDLSYLPEAYKNKPLALFRWNPIVSDTLLRYDVRVENHPELYFQVLPTSVIDISGVTYNFAVIPVEINTSYVFKVQQITTIGAKSTYSILSVATPVSMEVSNLESIEGFKVDNLASDGTFTGPNLVLSWNPLITPAELDNIYLEFYNPATNFMFFSATLPTTATTYTLTLNSNIAGFIAENALTGAYRNIVPKIRTVKGTSFSKWSELPND